MTIFKPYLLERRIDDIHDFAHKMYKIGERKWCSLDQRSGRLICEDMSGHNNFTNKYLRYWDIVEKWAIDGSVKAYNKKIDDELSKAAGNLNNQGKYTNDIKQYVRKNPSDSKAIREAKKADAKLENYKEKYRYFKTMSSNKPHKDFKNRLGSGKSMV